MHTVRREQSYKEMIWLHLANYKVSELGIFENGIWKKNRKEYSHILPFEHLKLNILEPYRTEFWQWFRTQEIKLHSDFHHLSSSQAMCFNLFFPFIAENKKYMQKLGEVFKTEGEIQDAQFEVVLNKIEFTNFDFCITAASKCPFELKFTEESFGRTKADEEHLLKFSETYLPTLDGKFQTPFCSSDVFFRHYQMMRNIWSLELSNTDKLLFLVPRANKRLKADLAFLDTCLSDAYRPRVSVIFLEDVLDCIEKNIPDTSARMREHFRQFRQKYLPTIPLTYNAVASREEGR